MRTVYNRGGGGGMVLLGSFKGNCAVYVQYLVSMRTVYNHAALAGVSTAL